MSINISQLHIGSHVSVDGKRVRVCGITKRKIGYHHPDSRPDAHLCYARIHDVGPIPLTTALLEELGFEWRDGIHRWMMKCGDTAGLFVEENRSLGYFVDVHSLRYDWRNPLLCVKYLHELEGQLAYYGIELNKE